MMPATTTFVYRGLPSSDENVGPFCEKQFSDRENEWMRIASYGDAGWFLSEAGAQLMVDVARHQLILGIGETVRQQPDVYPEYHAWAVYSGGELMAAASCTPPHKYVLADSSSVEVLDDLVAVMADSGVTAPGVIGNTPTVTEFVTRWSGATGSEARKEMGQGVFTLDSVEGLELSAGRIREADLEDREQLITWWQTFFDEVLPDEPISRDDAAERVDQRLDPVRPQGVSLWEHAGRVVAMSAHSAPVANSVRIGPVYTPPEFRGRGYGTALVATQSKRFLDEGRDRCLLYTDLANPTSNAIYRRIGYRQVAESAVYRFEAAAASDEEH